MAKAVRRSSPRSKKKATPVAPQQSITDLYRLNKWALIAALSLAAITFAVYWQTLRYAFVLYDDPYYVTDNLYVKAGLTGQGIMWAMKSFAYANWHPLTWISLMLDRQAFGMNPLGFHLTNVLLHIANTLLLFAVLHRMTRSLWRSAFVAALFAVHPLHVESVVWVTERKDVLSTLFWMLTTWAYVRYAERPGFGRYLLVPVFLALGLMAKPMLVTLPFVLLLLDFWPLKRGLRIWEKIPLFILSAASCLVTMSAQRAGMARLDALPLLVRAENAVVSYATYIMKMVRPTDLTCCYLFNTKLPVWQVLGAAVFLIAVTILAVRARKSRPYLTVGWLWYLGTLIPVIGLVQVGPQSMADRYTYVPLIGLFLMIAWGIPELLSRPSLHPHPNPLPPAGEGAAGAGSGNHQPSTINHSGTNTEHRTPKTILLAAAALLVVAILSGMAYRQVQYWHDDQALFGHALKVTGPNWIAYNGLGTYLAGKGDYQGALKNYEAALRLSPQNETIHNNLGYVLDKMGRSTEAFHHYDMAMRINPRDARAHTNMGMALVKRAHVDAAIAQYRKALELDPNMLQARQGLGDALMFKGDLAGAVREYKKVLRWDPQDWKTRCNLAIAYSYQGKFSDAESELAQASRLDPKNPQIHTNLAILLIQDNKIDQAGEEAQAAIRVRPDFPDGHAVLASVLFAHGRYADAWSEVHLCRKYHGTPNPDFLKALSSKMADPGK